jgi:hypothetical protein
MEATKLATLLMFLVLTTVGCAPCRADVAEKEGVSLEYGPTYSMVVSPATSVTISRADAYRKDNDFVVTGKVKRTHEINLPGHMDLAVCAPDGTLLVQETTRIPGLVTNRKGVIELPFTFSLDSVPPEEAIVRLNYHAPPFKDEDHLRCT